MSVPGLLFSPARSVDIDSGTGTKVLVGYTILSVESSSVIALPGTTSIF